MEREYKCIFIPQGPDITWAATRQWCDDVTKQIDALVKKGWEIVHIQGGEIFHLKRGYRMQPEATPTPKAEGRTFASLTKGLAA